MSKRKKLTRQEMIQRLRELDKQLICGPRPSFFEQVAAELEMLTKKEDRLSELVVLTK